MDIEQINADLASKQADLRVQWAIDRFADKIFLSSSFGVQAAVLLHMATRVWPEIPVVLIDTGYLFPETYAFVEELRGRLNLNLRVFRAELSPAAQEAKFGKLWEQGVEGIELYNQMNKVEPMDRAIRELGAEAWLAGLRRDQSESREGLEVVGLQNGLVKVHPIFDWTNRDVGKYLKTHNLPWHPLFEKGYVSIGDMHTTRPLLDGMKEEETRFFGLKRECGLHVQKKS